MKMETMSKVKRMMLMGIILSQAICTELFAQEMDRVPYYIPPSPTAYELGKYGQIPIGLFTGTPNISVPLYQYKTKNITIPISLSYNSNGIKVDQIESNVGLGWSLNVGGVITRIVRDIPDENSRLFYPAQEISELGVDSPMGLTYFNEIGQDQADSEADLYIFNFMGKSGKFVIDHNKGVVLIPYQDIEIIHVSGSTRSFIITTPDGVKYFFSDVERSTNYVEELGHQDQRNIITAWYLSKIVHPLGDEVYFTYVGQGYSYINSKSQTLEVWDITQSNCMGNSLGGPVEQTFTNWSIISGVCLTSITSNNPFDGRVELSHGYHNYDITGYDLVSRISIINQNQVEQERFDFQYTNTTNKRKFLKTVTFKDPGKSYQFDYINPEGLPVRLTYGQDHWGFFNNMPNTKLLPLITDHGMFESVKYNGANKEPNGAVAKFGLLSQVIYPTKGYTILEYEPNSYYGSKVIPAEEQQLHFGIPSENTRTLRTDPKPLNVNFHQILKLKVYVADIDPVTCPNSAKDPQAEFDIIDNSTNQSVRIFSYSATGYPVDHLGSFNPDERAIDFYADITPGSYTVTLTIYTPCAGATADLNYKTNEAQTIPSIVETGGLRVKQTIDHDPTQGTDIIKRYYYGAKETPSMVAATPGSKSYYTSDKLTSYQCENLRTLMVTSSVLTSSSITSLFNMGNNNISYKYVTISHGGDSFQNGGEEHQFTINPDVPGNSVLGSWIKNAPLTNSGWDNGNETRVTYFKKNSAGGFTNLKEIINHYTQDERNFSKVTSYSVRKNYQIFTTNDLVYHCTPDDLNKKYEYHYCAADHEHKYVFNNYCIASNADNTIGWNYHPCFEATLPKDILFPENIRNLDIARYENRSYWSYLDRTESREYDTNGENPISTTTTYRYDNPNHIQLTGSKTSSSIGDSVESRTYYPDDNLVALGISSDQDLLIKRLGNGANGLHRIAEPVQTEQFVNGHKTATKRTLYRDWIRNGNHLILPEFVQASTGINDLEDRIIYHSYDVKGNPLELSKSKDSHTAYYWGYNVTYPVVRAENVSYDDLDSAINASTTNLENLLLSVGDMTTPQQKKLWKDFNSTLRANPLLAKSIVSTYTFKPMIGIASETDPNGLTTYYEYDEYDRLAAIKDNQLNVLKQYDYHYSGSPLSDKFFWTVNFDSRWGSVVDNIITSSNSTIQAPLNPTLTGNTFVGWFKEASCVNPWSFTNDHVTANTTLYAKWNPIIYTVTFNSQLGSAVASVNASYGSRIAVPATPTRTGYTFGGWHREVTCTSPWNFLTSTVTADITLYAKWNIITYMVTFNSQLGSAVANVIASHGSTIASPATPTRTGYTFRGWYREATCTTPWSFPTSTVTAATTLYAKWTTLAINIHSIEFGPGNEYCDVIITSNCSWTITKNVSWLTCSPSSGSNSRSIRISCARLTSRSRNGVVTITGDGVTAKIFVNQSMNSY